MGRKASLLFLASLTFGCSAINGQSEDSLVKVLGFQYGRSSSKPEKEKRESTAPASALIPEDKNFRRNARQLEPHDALDPKKNSIDGRSEALERNVNDARSPHPERTVGFTYQIRLRNDHSEKIEILFWEYRSIDLRNPSNVVRRQFLCGVRIGPGKESEVSAFSTLGLAAVVEAKDAGNQFREEVQINRVEYSNGAILQRKDWDHQEIRPSIERALATPWGKETCRGL